MSAVAAIAAIAWIGERAFHFSNPIDTLVTRPAGHPLPMRGILAALAVSATIASRVERRERWENGTDESFNGRFRDECLSVEWFRIRLEATVVIETWREHYNHVRPHSSLGYLTPNEFKIKKVQSSNSHREAQL